MSGSAIPRPHGTAESLPRVVPAREESRRESRRPLGLAPGGRDSADHGSFALVLAKYTKRLARVALERLHVPIVPISVKDPVVASMLYIRTVLELWSTPYANLPDGWIVLGPGDNPAPVVPANVKAPVVVSIV